MNLSGKKILLGAYSISEYGSAEINCLNLAESFIGMGARVDIAAFDLADPFKKEFELRGIPVKNVLTEELSFDLYDIVWVHSYIMLDYLIFNKHITSPKIVFSVLAPASPVGMPPEYVNELSLCLAANRSIKEAMIESGVAANKIILFPDYVTRRTLLSANWSEPSAISRVAVIMDEVPREVAKASEMLGNRGVTVDIYDGSRRDILINEALLSRYDAVVSGGRTALCCMGLRIPLYCYGAEGGPGWINESCFEKVERYDFSGYGFERKSAGEIYEQISAGRSSIEFLHSYVKSNCVLENNLSELMSILSESKDTFVDKIVRAHKTRKSENEFTVGLFSKNIELSRRAPDSEKRKYERELSEQKRQIDILESEIIERNRRLMEQSERWEQKLAETTGLLTERTDRLGKQETVITELQFKIDELNRLLERTCRELDDTAAQNRALTLQCEEKDRLLGSQSDGKWRRILPSFGKNTPEKAADQDEKPVIPLHTLPPQESSPAVDEHANDSRFDDPDFRRGYFYRPESEQEEPAPAQPEDMQETVSEIAPNVAVFDKSDDLDLPESDGFDDDFGQGSDDNVPEQENVIFENVPAPQSEEPVIDPEEKKPAAKEKILRVLKKIGKALKTAALWTGRALKKTGKWLWKYICIGAYQLKLMFGKLWRKITKKDAERYYDDGGYEEYDDGSSFPANNPYWETTEARSDTQFDESYDDSAPYDA